MALDEMGHIFVGNTFDDIFHELLWSLSQNPHHICSPRGQKIKENLNVNLILGNPRARLLSPKARATNYGFGVGEFLWYWQGKQDLETMLYYNKRMKDFSNDGRTLNSAYGWRLKKAWPGNGKQQMTQWEVCKETLLADPDSRRAILLINDPFDQYEAFVSGSKDVPCTLSLQFFIRNDAADRPRLHLHVHMRSNDAMWGLTYDLFSFTLFQECMLFELRRHEKFKDLELGRYYHTAGSLHIYERHFEQAKEIVREYCGPNLRLESPMEPLESLGELERLCKAEEALRKSTEFEDDIFSLSYLGGLRWMADQLEKHHEKRKAEVK